MARGGPWSVQAVLSTVAMAKFKAPEPLSPWNCQCRSSTVGVLIARSVPCVLLREGSPWLRALKMTSRARYRLTEHASEDSILALVSEAVSAGR